MQSQEQDPAQEDNENFAAEKAIQVQQCRKSQETFRNDLKEPRAVILAEAVKLHQKHGGHNLNYYVELLYQNGQQKGGRKVSNWNAWVHLESKRLNEGCGSSR